MGAWIFEHGEEVANEVSSTSSSTTSSIGKDSDWSTSESSDSNEEEEEEVQSAFNAKQGFLNSLEDALPFRKGISAFYAGRSMSFACMDDAASLTSIKEIVKAETAYNRRHRNLIAFKHVWPKETTSVHCVAGGISKKPATKKWTGLTLARTISDSSCNSNNSNLASRASTNNLVALNVKHKNVCRRSISLPSFLVLPQHPTIS